MAHLLCSGCGGEFFVDTKGMNCPNCKVWMEGEKFSPSSAPTKEPTDEERALLTEFGAAALSKRSAEIITWQNLVPEADTIRADGNSGDQFLEEEVVKVMKTAFRLWQDRQAKYGRGNIARTGAVGCYIRCEDKMARLHGVYVKGRGDMPDESISDSWLDLINYAVMGYMCHHNLWPGQSESGWYGETNALASRSNKPV